MRFWDSSAIVPLLIHEPTFERLRQLLLTDAEMMVWWATAVECTSALARREREGLLAVSVANSAYSRLRELSLTWAEMLPSNPVRMTAQRLLRMHPLRAADSLQLAAAIVAAENDPPTLQFVTLDLQLAAAASREGFEVIVG
jgi:uncharacterized protein